MPTLVNAFIIDESPPMITLVCEKALSTYLQVITVHLCKRFLIPPNAERRASVQAGLLHMGYFN